MVSIFEFSASILPRKHPVQLTGLQDEVCSPDFTCDISIADSTATTDTHGSTSDTYGRWNIASQRGSWQLRETIAK